MKICNLCKQPKEFDQYSLVWSSGRTNRGTRVPMARCKSCVYLIYKQRYSGEEGKRKKAAIRLTSRTKRIKKFRDLKESTPCNDCQQHYPYYVMQFDHVRGEKIAAVGTFLSLGDWKAAEEEIKKCEIVCSNCHAERTQQRHDHTEG